MAIGISALAFAIRKQSAFLPKPVVHGHAQQLVAAALGYKSLAGYQTSHEEQADLSRTRHIVLDEALLLQRADELGLNYRDDVVVSLVIDSLTHTLPHVTVHRTKGAFDDMLRDYIDDIVLNHDETVGQMAMSNGSLGEVYLPFETLLEDIPYDDVKEFSIIGHVGMTPDVERPYVGHIVHVSASLFLTRYGRFCVGEPQCRVNAAKLAWLGDDGSEGEQPTTPLANALAEELGIEREDAEASCRCRDSSQRKQRRRLNLFVHALRGTRRLPRTGGETAEKVRFAGYRIAGEFLRRSGVVAVRIAIVRQQAEAEASAVKRALVRFVSLPQQTWRAFFCPRVCQEHMDAIVRCAARSSAPGQHRIGRCSSRVL